MKDLKRFVHTEDGATLIEYGIIITLLALVCVTALGSIGQNVTEKLESLANDMGEEA